jgi:hypothetical protein
MPSSPAGCGRLPALSVFFCLLNACAPHLPIAEGGPAEVDPILSRYGVIQGAPPLGPQFNALAL